MLMQTGWEQPVQLEVRAFVTTIFCTKYSRFGTRGFSCPMGMAKTVLSAIRPPLTV